MKHDHVPENLRKDYVYQKYEVQGYRDEMVKQVDAFRVERKKNLELAPP